VHRRGARGRSRACAYRGVVSHARFWAEKRRPGVRAARTDGRPRSDRSRRSQSRPSARRRTATARSHRPRATRARRPSDPVARRCQAAVHRCRPRRRPHNCAGRSGRPPPPATTAHQTLLLRSPPTRRLVAICKGATILRLTRDCAGARADDAGLAASGRAPALASGRGSRRPRRGPSPARKPSLVPAGSAMAFDCGSSVGRVRESVRGSDRGVRLHGERGSLKTAGRPLRSRLAPGFSSWAAPATCGAPAGSSDTARGPRLLRPHDFMSPRVVSV
jgi:hypothetical protein